MTDDPLAALRALFEPQTQTVEVQGLPKTRRQVCAKCPFGDRLTPGEQSQANAIKDRLTGNPNALWGCHETIGGKPMICAGFAKWRKENAEATRPPQQDRR